MAVEKVTATLEEATEVLESTSEVDYSGSMEAPLSAGVYSVDISAYDDDGNVVTESEDLDVSWWRTPKTDWKQGDAFNFEDYNRIKNNLVYLHELAVSLWKPFDIEDMGDDIYDYQTAWDVDVFNKWERNLDVIDNNIFWQDFGTMQVFFTNGKFIDHNELNRIEGAILAMNEVLERQKAGLRRLSFRLGTYKGGFRI